MPVYNEEKLLHGVKENVDEIRREYQIEFITRYKRDNQQLPDKWASVFRYRSNHCAVYLFGLFRK